MALVVKKPPANANKCKRRGFDPWVGKIPWRGKWQPSAVFLPGKFHAQRNLVGYRPWVTKSQMWLNTHAHICCIASNNLKLSSVQLLIRVRLFATPWITACQASLSIINSQGPSKPMSIELVMPSNHLILCRPLLLLPSIFPSIRVFSNESALCIRWTKYWSFSFNISPSNEHPGLISFRMDWLDLLAVQGTLKSLLQHCSSKASILRCSAFFIVQLSHPYMTTGKTTALNRRIFVDKVMSLLFSMLSRLVMG